MSNNKDSITFEGLYKDHFAFLSLVAFNITKDKDVANDIVQDFFIYMWEREESIRLIVSFKAYATRAVKNLSLQHLDKTKTISLQDKNLIIPILEELTPFEKTDEKEQNKIHTLIEKIPQARREIFTSHIVEGYSYAEISEMYNISINTVKTQMKRAYAFLREFEKTAL